MIGRLNRSPCSIPLNPVGDQVLRGRMPEQRLERGDGLGESSAVARRHDAVVPLHRARQGRRAQVRAADERRAAVRRVRRCRPSDGTTEQIGTCWTRRLDAARFEHAALDVALEVEQAHQRVRFGDAEVVAGEDSQLSSPRQEVPEVLEHAVDAALEDEADDDVGAVGGGELGNDVRQERVVAARDQVALAIAVAASAGRDSSPGPG